MRMKPPRQAVLKFRSWLDLRYERGTAVGFGKSRRGMKPVLLLLRVKAVVGGDGKGGKGLGKNREDGRLHDILYRCGRGEAKESFSWCCST